MIRSILFRRIFPAVANSAFPLAVALAAVRRHRSLRAHFARRTRTSLKHQGTISGLHRFVVSAGDRSDHSERRRGPGKGNYAPIAQEASAI